MGTMSVAFGRLESSGRLLAGAALVALAMTATAGLAEARQAGFAGGQGGGPFESPCPAFTALTGFAIRAGKAMDNIQPYCSDVRPNKEVGQPAAAARPAGGNGGVARNGVVCRTHFIVTGMTVFVDKFNIVNHVTIQCTEIGDGRVEEKSWAFEGEVARSQAISCNRGEYANGIYGRYGALVDAVGLLCERAEVIQPALAAKPAAPPTPTPGRADAALCATYAAHVAEAKTLKCDFMKAGNPWERSAESNRCLRMDAGSVKSNDNSVLDMTAKCKTAQNQKTTTVKNDVDLYAAPPPLNGEQKGRALPNGLKKGQKVGFVSCRSDNWCQVTGGWVFGDFITK